MSMNAEAMIKEILAKRGWTLRRLALEIENLKHGITAPTDCTMSNWKNGKHAPGTHHMARLRKIHEKTMKEKK